MTALPATPITHDSAGVDIEAAQRAASGLPSAMGIDADRGHLRNTPARMARAYAELLRVRRECRA